MEQPPTTKDSFRTKLPDGSTTAAYLPDGSLIAASSGQGGYEVSGSNGILRFQAAGASPDALAASATGDRLLLHFADDTLQVQQGADQPRTIATGVQGAAWLPATASSTATTTTTAQWTTTTTKPLDAHGRPARVFALTTDGDVVELDSSDGHQLRTIAHVDAPPDASIAVTPDGKTIYTEQAQSQIILPCDPKVVSIDVATGKTTSIARGRDPALNASGTKLAYVPVDCSQRWERVAVRDLTDGKEATWNLIVSEAGLSVDGLSFDPDGRFVLARFSGGPSAGALILDTTKSADAGDATRVVPGSTPTTGSIASQYLGTTGLLVGLETTADGTINVRSIDPVTGAFVGLVGSTEGPGTPGMSWRILDTDVSGEHLLLDVYSASRPPSSYLAWWYGSGLHKLAPVVIAATWSS
jgi:DNA-binding beta-propeller fold protein YncE